MELEGTIQSIFNVHDGNYGYRRIQLELKNQGILVNHKKVQRIMRKLGIKGSKFMRKSRRYSTYKGYIWTIAKNLVRRRFYTDRCHRKLTTDITDFKCLNGTKLYLSPIMDLYNGEIISYGIHTRPTLNLVIQETLKIVKDTPNCTHLL